MLLPLSQPPNPLLTQRPAPLSQAMPAHSATATGHTEHEGIGAKIKNFFHKSEPAPTPVKAEEAAQASQATVDPIVDQNAKGETVPTPQANAVGATNLNANAETAWPGLIQGQNLGAVVVDLRAVDKDKVVLNKNKKEGFTVTVPVSASVIFSLLEPVGSHTSNRGHKSGEIRFEFDKDWIGAKGEAELLLHSIVSSIETLGAASAHGSPKNQTFHLGGSNATAPAPARDIAPDQVA